MKDKTAKFLINLPIRVWEGLERQSVELGITLNELMVQITEKTLEHLEGELKNDGK